MLGLKGSPVAAREAAIQRALEVIQAACWSSSAPICQVERLVVCMHQAHAHQIHNVQPVCSIEQAVPHSCLHGQGPSNLMPAHIITLLDSLAEIEA